MEGFEAPARVDFAVGDATGIAIPAHGQALLDAGPEFLTVAFRAFGWLAADNTVTAITRWERCNVGSTGEKFWLTVTYARAATGLGGELFVKFSRDFADAFRDRRRGELAAEVRVAELARLPDFPVAVPRACFADFEQASGTGLIINERIAYGENGIEQLHRKCMDHALSNPLEYYQTILKAEARLAAAHQSGRLSPAAETLFPFDVEAAVAEDKIAVDAARLRELVAEYAAFAASCPRLLPEHLREAAFIARLERDGPRILAHEAAVKRYLHANPDYIAFSHFNAHIDNAWFWRDVAGVLQCGLLDWQRARQMNLAYALWGCLCGASLEIWDQHLDALLALFIRELHAAGGRLLDAAELKLHLCLYAATMGLAQLINVPAIVRFRHPDAERATSLRDAMFHANESALGFLHIFIIFLNLWDAEDFGACLDRVLARGG